MPHPKKNETARTTANPPISKVENTSAETNQPALPCHINDEMWKWDEKDEIRETVCVAPAEFPLREFEDKHYCLFHYPSKDKGKGGLEKFAEIFKERLETVDKKCAKIEAEFPDDEEKQLTAKREKNIRYDFRYVWFPQKVYLGRKFLCDVTFIWARFSSDAIFTDAIFLSHANFRSAKFLSEASFIGAKFLYTALFIGAEFWFEAQFARATFMSDVHFSQTKFSKTEQTSFYVATFEKDSYFDKVEFNNEVRFESANFGKDSDIFFRKTFFAKKADFQYCKSEGYLRFANLRQDKESYFDFQEATFEKASRISFHTVRLQPNWFVNIDSRKFVFTDISWENIDWKEKRNLRRKLGFALDCFKSGWLQFFGKTGETICENISAELESLEKRKITDQKKRLLEVTCRQLAVNAEENNRYEEASKFRYMAMETKRLEYRGVWRFLNLHWFYKWSSGYGESWARAAVVLLGILFLCGVFFNTHFAYFEAQEKKKEGENLIYLNDCERDCGKLKPKPPEYYKMNNSEGFIHSLNVAALQRPEPKPATDSYLTRAVIILETIFAPLQAALLALAIRRKFMR